MSTYSLSGYASMLSDPIRVEAYEAALREAITPGCTVLEIGTGPGFFAVLACRMGAGLVHAVEPDDTIEVARELAEANGVADRIVFHQEMSTRVDIDDPADVLFSDLRGVLPLDEFHVPARLRKTVRKTPFRVTADTAFNRVMEACAEPGPGRESTWLSPELMDLYEELHRQGYAHSVECWLDGKLAGGLYGVSVGGLFAGESMFHRVRDASKVALVHLSNKLADMGYRLIDCQVHSGHLQTMGAIPMQRELFVSILDNFCKVDFSPAWS